MQQQQKTNNGIWYFDLSHRLEKQFRNQFLQAVHYKGQILTKSRLVRRRFSQKMSKQISFCCFFTLHGKKTHNLHSFFGRIYGAQIYFRFYLTFRKSYLYDLRIKYVLSPRPIFEHTKKLVCKIILSWTTQSLFVENACIALSFLPGNNEKNNQN